MYTWIDVWGLKGAVSAILEVGGSKFIDITDTKTGKFKDPCECCQKVLDKLGIKVKCN